ncbi:hypothetical protein BASA61_004113 [Batrachochytrium salamandrivorans]|nr:hypothetical protein BASA61_004113 [Batrachochytrium salamandrivorans]
MSPGPAIIKISDGFVIHCLTETNYHQWAKGITTHLMMTDSWIPHIIDEPPKNPSKTFILRDNVICSLISSTIDQNQMHLVSDAHGYPMFAKACWESIKAAYTSASITDGMDLYRDLNKVFYDPSLGVANFWIKWISYGANSLLPLSHLRSNLGQYGCLQATGWQ